MKKEQKIYDENINISYSGLRGSESWTLTAPSQRKIDTIEITKYENFVECFLNEYISIIKESSIKFHRGLVSTIQHLAVP